MHWFGPPPPHCSTMAIHIAVPVVMTSCVVLWLGLIPLGIGSAGMPQALSALLDVVWAAPAGRLDRVYRIGLAARAGSCAAIAAAMWAATSASARILSHLDVSGLGAAFACTGRRAETAGR